MKIVNKIRFFIPFGVFCWALLGLYLDITAFFVGSTLLLASSIALLFLQLRLLKSSQRLIDCIEDFKAGNRGARVNADPDFDLLGPVAFSINDLLDKTEAEEWRLNEKRIRYKSLIEMMAEGLITMTSEGSIESMNSAAEKLLGFTEQELIGQKISAIITDPDSNSPETYLNRFIDHEEEGCPSPEIEVKTKSGTKTPILFSVSKMIAQQATLYIGVMSDISEIKSLEVELRSLNEELGKSNRRLEKTAITDSLTSLFNRRHFDDTLAKELQRSTRQRTSISLIVVDIDFFKQFNDAYGHTAGDDCLQKVARCIKQVFKRSGDLPARYGGEEFAIILPGCDGLELQERAETLRQEIFALAIPHKDSSVEDRLTVSIGAVTYKPASSDVSGPKLRALFGEADKALYQAKARGRNQVVFAGQFQPMRIPSITTQLYGQFITR